MSHSFEDLSDQHLSEAATLFQSNYLSERKKNPLLPKLNLEKIESKLKDSLLYPGIAVIQDGTLIAFLQTSYIGVIKGQKAAFVSEFGHARKDLETTRIFWELYVEVSQKWLSQDIQLHMIGHLSQDLKLKETLFSLGFGAIISEKIRDLKPVENVNHPTFKIDIVSDYRMLLSIQKEHNDYYSNAPMFVPKSSDESEIENYLKACSDSGDSFLVFLEDNEPKGYCIVGESAKDDELFLLSNTNTAQIKSAYIKPEYRSKNLGSFFLNESIKLANEKGFHRLAVEHETANFFGAKFWDRHFHSYLYFSTRYVENTRKK